MSKLIIVEKDIVSNFGQDKHSVVGKDKVSKLPVPNQFSYDFSGKVKEKNSGNDFVTISSIKIITKGNNECPQDKDHKASEVTLTEKAAYELWAKVNDLIGFGIITPVGIPAKDDPDNNGENSNDAGSSFVTIKGAPVILDGDNFDTCHFDGLTNKGRAPNSTVKAEGQNFVTVTES